MADLDGDGQLDLFSGSYWPGDLSMFRGLGGGKFAAGVFLQAKGGGNLNAGPLWESADEPHMDSLAASPAPVDWDADGDFDLLVGNIAGRVILILNEGDAKNPAFGAKRAVQAADKDLEVDGDAGPAVADWDGDGRWDLLVGADDGSVRWFRNVGTASAPEFAAGTILVEGAGWNGATIAAGTVPTHPGVRVKPATADWNRDGLLDLLVGDFVQQKRPEPVLNDEQRAERDRLRAEMAALSEQPPGEDELAQSAWSERWARLYQALEPLEAGETPCGFVWVYLRQPAASKAAGR